MFLMTTCRGKTLGALAALEDEIENETDASLPFPLSEYVTIEPDRPFEELESSLDHPGNVASAVPSCTPAKEYRVR